MKKLLFISIAAFCLALNSCISILSINKGEKGAKVWVNEEEGRTFVYVPMIHVQKPGFFARTKEYLDHLKSEGFVVFYELSIDRDTLDIDQLLINYRKFRKISGYRFFSTEGSSVSRPLRNGKYVLQTRELLGLTTDRDIWADLYTETVIELYENEYGEIELDDYDYDTPLRDKYKSTATPNQRYAFNRKYRDEHLSEMLMESEYPDIAVVYGSAHYYSAFAHVAHKLGFTELSRREVRKARRERLRMQESAAGQNE